MYDKLHEKIQVTATFASNGKAIIERFTWKNKDYPVTEVTLITKAYHGRDTVWMFHVVTPTAAFKLRFDTDTMNWWLEESTWEEQASD